MTLKNSTLTKCTLNVPTPKRIKPEKLENVGEKRNIGSQFIINEVHIEATSIIVLRAVSSDIACKKER